MTKTVTLILTVAIGLFASGCNTTYETDGKVDVSKKPDDHGDSDHKAPRGGNIIELGSSHEYHAELVDDHETESITVYMMDGRMKDLTVPETSIELVLTAGDETKTFELLAGQPGGSSTFSSNDKDMMKMIETKGATGTLRVKLDGKQHKGSFEHHEH